MTAGDISPTLISGPSLRAYAFEALQAWGGDGKELDSFDHFASILANPEPHVPTSGAVSNIGEGIASAIHTLRSIPETAQDNITWQTNFQGEIELQSGLGFSFTKVWSKYWVEVKGFRMYYRILRSDPEPLGSIPIAFIIDPSDYINTSAAYTADHGISKEKFELERDEYVDFSSRELNENILKIVAKSQVVMCRFPTLSKKQIFFRSVQENLQQVFGAQKWQDKLDAALQAQPVIKKHVFLQYYHMRCIMQSLEVAGMISAASSMLASSYKKFQGLVVVDDNINEMESKSASHFMVLYDHTLYWFRSSSSPSPESFVPLMVASIRFDEDRIRKGQWSLILETPIRSITITTRHAISLCEWFSAIREDIGDLVGDGAPAESTNDHMRHGRTLSTFSTMWKRISVARDDGSLEDPLIDNENDSFLHNTSGYLEHVINLRAQGYTIDDIISRKSAVQGFCQFLSCPEESDLLNCLFELKGAASISVAEGRRIVEKYITQGAEKILRPTLIAKLSSLEESHNIASTLVEVEKELRSYFEGIVKTARESNEFRCFVQDQLHISTNTEMSFENDSMRLALIITLKGERSQTVFLDPEKSTVTIGRDPSNDVVISDKHVSRSHIKLSYSKEHLALHDLGSSAGVQVNGVQVQYCNLQPGDVFVIGTTEILFSLQAPKPKRGVRALLNLFHRFGLSRSDNEQHLKD